MEISLMQHQNISHQNNKLISIRPISGPLTTTKSYNADTLISDLTTEFPVLRKQDITLTYSDDLTNNNNQQLQLYLQASSSNRNNRILEISNINDIVKCSQLFGLISNSNTPILLKYFINSKQLGNGIAFAINQAQDFQLLPLNTKILYIKNGIRSLPKFYNQNLLNSIHTLILPSSIESLGDNNFAGIVTIELDNIKQSRLGSDLFTNSPLGSNTIDNWYYLDPSSKARCLQAEFNNYQKTIQNIVKFMAITPVSLLCATLALIANLISIACLATTPSLPKLNRGINQFKESAVYRRAMLKTPKNCCNIKNMALSISNKQEPEDQSDLEKNLYQAAAL